MKDGDTFWYHECPYSNTNRYIRVGVKCEICEWEELSISEKAKVRQREHIERMEQNYDT